MRVLVISLFYAPDHAAGSQMLTELCEELASLGDEVTVVASRGTYLGGEQLPARETIHGVQVVRAWATSFGKASIPGRLTDYATFWATAIATALRQATPDVVLAVSFPPMITAGAALVAKARGVPLVTWVQDVYPEVAVALGVMREGSVTTKAFAALQHATHQASESIVAISAGMARRLVNQGANESRLHVVANWSDGNLIRPRESDESNFRRQHGLVGRFVIMYSGNLGAAHEFAAFIEAAKKLKNERPEILFLFIGEGGRKAEVERLARGLNNVRFLPYQAKDSLGESLAAADSHLISLREGLDGLVVPSKIYGAMACGRPIFFMGPLDCEVARVIWEVECGWVGKPGDAVGLANALERAAADATWSLEAGRRARFAFEQEYDRSIGVKRWREVLHSAISSFGHLSSRDAS